MPARRPAARRAHDADIASFDAERRAHDADIATFDAERRAMDAERNALMAQVQEANRVCEASRINEATRASVAQQIDTKVRRGKRELLIFLVQQNKPFAASV